MLWLKAIMLALPFLTEIAKLIREAVEAAKKGEQTAHGETPLNAMKGPWARVQKLLEKINVDKTT